ncbi:hypothetical protein JIN85_09640 [Luteolibacter pohnpeiensis]|uniref:Uncharacterized protein n=1 Tax=Luteolibacter pohnpeiensis TaxID=454153 RepID=A0A934VWN1_9BACT|nr:hypothetical protein [Luteolibacter pohnpeiensis]MBK1882679.1 hypothetical protein [Luteolibacter pohnpeiensis]
MASHRQRFIDLATSNSPDSSESKIRSVEWLDQQLPQDGVDFASAVQRWEMLDSRPKARAWRKSIYWLLLTFALLAGLPVVWMMREPAALYSSVASLYGNIGGFSIFSITDTPISVSDELSDEEKLLLGDQSIPLLEQKMQLWKSDPGNPAFYSEYAVTYFTEQGKLPPDYDQIVARIDPDNAWFDYFAAGAETPVRAVEKSSEQFGSMQKRGDLPAVVPPDWVINDSAAMEAALNRVRVARGKPRFQSYLQELTQQRIPLLSQDTPVNYVRSLAYIIGEPRGDLELRKLGKIFAAKAYTLGEASDIEGLRDLRLDAMEFSEHLEENDDRRMFPQLVTTVTVPTVMEALHKAETKLGIEKEDPRVESKAKAYETLELERERRSLHGSAASQQELVEERGGGLFAVLYTSAPANRLANPPPITEADLKPLRLMDHAAYSQFHTADAWAIMGLLLLSLALYRFRGHRELNGIARRLVQLLQLGDWCWIVFGGVVAPIFLTIGVIWLTPLGGTDWSVNHSRGYENNALPTFQYAAMVLWLVIQTSLMIQWRMRRRAPFFPISKWKLWVAMATIGVVVTALLGANHFWTEEVTPGLLVIGAFWVVTSCALALFSAPLEMPQRLAFAKIMQWPVVIAMLIFAAASIGFYEYYLHWFEKDDFQKFRAELPSSIPYEYRVGVQMKKERDAMLERF